MPHTSLTTATPLSGLRVLVVASDEDCLEVFALYLQACGAHVAAAQSVDDALGYVNGQRINAIVTDVSLLNGSAPDFLRHVREAPQYKSTPVIAVTGWNLTDAARIAQASFTKCIEGPLDLDELVDTIVRHAQPNAAQVS